MATATFRFYAGLNDFLRRERRGRGFACGLAEAANAKHAIEALGVPHTEVALLLVNGAAAELSRPLADGDRVAVYPKFESLGLAAPDVALGTALEAAARAGSAAPCAGPLRFIADAHLGGLARLLRMTGFDTVFDPALLDADIERLAAAEGRTVLTRDRELLKRRGVARGAFVRALHSGEQLREVFDRFDLARSSAPFSRCMACNAALQAVEKAAVEADLPPRVRERQQRFSRCPACARVYWEGSHWQRMRALIDALLSPST